MDVTTSQPSPGDLTSLWDRILEEGYNEIVHIPMFSGLSSFCATAKMLAEDYEGKAFVVDNEFMLWRFLPVTYLTGPLDS